MGGQPRMRLAVPVGYLLVPSKSDISWKREPAAIPCICQGHERTLAVVHVCGMGVELPVVLARGWSSTITTTVPRSRPQLSL